MDIRNLQAFIAVSSSGTLSKAAIALAVTQPVVTRQIRSLEDELGLELFMRNGRGMVLTDGGKLLLQRAEEIIYSLEKAKSDVMATRSNMSGKYVIGVPPSVGTVLTVPLVQKIKSEFPQIALRVIEGFSGHVLEWLANGRIDIGVLYNAAKYPSLLTEPLVDDELYLLGPANDPHNLGEGPISLDKLERLPLILPSRPHGLRVMLDTIFEQHHVTPNIEMELEAMPSTLMLVEEGVGYTILSYAAAHQLIQRGRMKYWPLTPKITRTLVLATSNQRPMTATLRTLVRIVRAEIRDLPGQIPVKSIVDRHQA